MLNNIQYSVVDQIEQLERELYIRGGKRPKYLVLSKSTYNKLKEERGTLAEEIPKYRGYFIYIIPIDKEIVDFE
jgi:hypothetical protein